MPDLLTHVIVSSAVARISKFHVIFSLFVIGNVLPDIFTRALDILLKMFDVNVGWFFLALHTPIGLLIFSYILCFSFSMNIRRNVFLSIYLGSLFHLFLDSLQKSFYKSSDFVLFPFSFETFSFDLFYYNSTVYPILCLVIITVIYKVISRVFKT